MDHQGELRFRAHSERPDSQDVPRQGRLTPPPGNNLVCNMHSFGCIALAILVWIFAAIGALGVAFMGQDLFLGAVFSVFLPVAWAAGRARARWCAGAN